MFVHNRVWFTGGVAVRLTSEVELALEALLFGSTWYFGILIFMLLSICIMVTWKYAGSLIIPMVVALEVAYYNRLDINGEFVWAMLVLLFLVVGIAIYTVDVVKKR